MKFNLKNSWAIMPLLFAAWASQAQPSTYVVDQFQPTGLGANNYATGQITNVWKNWFGGASQSVTWDAASDASNNASSGSLKILANFSGANNQYEVYNGLNGISPPLSGAQYTNFECDVRFAAGSATTTINSTASFGHLQFGVATASFGQDYFGFVDIPASNTNWVHVSIPLNYLTDTNLVQINDVLIHIYGPQYSPALSGTSTLWVDNIKFTGLPLANSGDCTVNWNDVHQRIDGFGASSAWRSTWSTAQANMFFSTTTGTGTARNGTTFSYTGIGLSFLRTRIAPDGSSVETGLMQLAQARGAKVWSAPWSPPVIYKDSGTVNGGKFVSSGTNYQGYANQLASYVRNMKNSYGVPLYAISIQNEPDANVTTYEACEWTAQQIHDFLPYLQNALTSNGVATTKILLAESQNWKFTLASNSLNDVTTSNLVGILAAHSYGSSASAVSGLGSPPVKPLWETEDSTLTGNDSSITDGVAWAGEIHNYLTVAEASAWHYWWLISGNSTSNQGLADTNDVPAKRMYTVGNFSRFVRPGYYRIGVSNSSLAQVSAYKYPNSGNFAIIAINPTSGVITQTFNLLGFPAPATVMPWITTTNLSLASQANTPVSGAAFSYALPAMSVVTFASQTNLAPVDITLLNSSIGENLSANTIVGTLLTEDPDPANTFTYSLVSGAGSTDNGSFNLSGSTLRSSAALNYEAQNPLSIRVRSTDQAGLSYDKVFSITVTDVNEAPNLTFISNQAINPGVVLVITNSASDPELPAQTLTFTKLNGPTNSTLNSSNGVLTWRPLLSQADTTNLLKIKVADNGTPNLSATNSYTITVNPLSATTLTSISLGDGQLSLLANGLLGPDYTWLTSTNLVDWQSLVTTNPTVMPLGLSVTNISEPQRFYRIQLGP